MKLLVCLDGSEMSLGALEPAAKMAAATNADVHLLRVLDVSDIRERTRGKMTASRRSTGDWSGRSLPGAGGGLWSGKAREQAMMIEDRGQALLRRRGRGWDRVGTGPDAAAEPDSEDEASECAGNGR